jgi:hypothetical protein
MNKVLVAAFALFACLSVSSQAGERLHLHKSVTVVEPKKEFRDLGLSFSWGDFKSFEIPLGINLQTFGSQSSSTSSRFEASRVYVFAHPSLRFSMSEKSEYLLGGIFGSDLLTTDRTYSSDTDSEGTLESEYFSGSFIVMWSTGVRYAVTEDFSLDMRLYGEDFWGGGRIHGLVGLNFAL